MFDIATSPRYPIARGRAKLLTCQQPEVPLLRIECEAFQPIPLSIPQHFQTRPAPANATKPICAARSRYIPNAPTLANAANAQVHRLSIRWSRVRVPPAPLNSSTKAAVRGHIGERRLRPYEPCEDATPGSRTSSPSPLMGVDQRVFDRQMFGLGEADQPSRRPVSTVSPRSDRRLLGLDCAPAGW